MDNRLMEYRPEFEVPVAPPRWQHDEAELALGAELLSAIHEGRLRPFLHGTALQAGLPVPLAHAMASAVLPLAQRVFRPHDPRKSARLFTMELEGLSPEDKEFELARHFIRFTRHAYRRARQLQRGDPRQLARAALAQAAREHAPGLLPYLLPARPF